jgi:hypothetical protein
LSSQPRTRRKRETKEVLGFIGPKEFPSKPREGPFQNETAPLVVFNGLKQDCEHEVVTLLIKHLREFNKHVECIPIGAG